MVATGGNKEEDAIQCEVLLHVWRRRERSVRYFDRYYTCDKST